MIKEDQLNTRQTIKKINKTNSRIDKTLTDLPRKKRKRWLPMSDSKEGYHCRSYRHKKGYYGEYC